MDDAPDLPPDQTLVMGGDLANVLWTSSGDVVLLDDLPITSGLRLRLEAWGDWAGDFEDFLPEDRRAPFDLEGCAAAGLELARALKAEMPGWKIVYCDEARWQQRERLGLAPQDCDDEV